MTPATFAAAASDVVEEKLHAAKKAVNARVREMEDLRDTATVGIRRAPLLAVGAALGIGLIAGAIVGFVSSRACGD